MADSMFTPTSAQTSDAESASYIFKRLLSGAFFIELVQVIAVRGDMPSLVVDVMPLVARTDQNGAIIGNSPVFNIPVFRLQRGTSAIIMNPVVNDIGMMAVCDRDTSIARANLKQSAPGTKRNHSKSDGLYLGGFLNPQPTEYVEFKGSGIDIKSTGTVNINGLKILPDGRLQLVDGSIVDGHDHGGVSSGGSRTSPLGP